MKLKRFPYRQRRPIFWKGNKAFFFGVCVVLAVWIHFRIPRVAQRWAHLSAVKTGHRCPNPAAMWKKFSLHWIAWVPEVQSQLTCNPQGTHWQLIKNKLKVHWRKAAWVRFLRGTTPTPRENDSPLCLLPWTFRPMKDCALRQLFGGHSGALQVLFKTNWNDRTLVILVTFQVNWGQGHLSRCRWEASQCEPWPPAFLKLLQKLWTTARE